MTRRATAAIGEGELRIGPPTDQPDHAKRFVAAAPRPLLHRFLVAFDLGGDRFAQAKALGYHLAGQFLEPIIEWGVEVSQRLEKAERNQGGNSGPLLSCEGDHKVIDGHPPSLGVLAPATGQAGTLAT